MRKFRTAGAVFALALFGAFLHSPPASARPPDAEVHLHALGHQGQHDTILADLRGRCAPGFAFQELVIDFRQGGFTAPSTFGSSFPCDGLWHEQRVSSPEGFEPGPAIMSARLGVTDIITGDPGHEGVQTRRIYVRPAARILLPRTALLRPHGVLKIVTRARCDRPWVLQSYGLDLTQGEFPDLAAGTASTETRPRCDGAYHRMTFWVTSVQDVAFHRGWVQVNASLSLLDPHSFDPVAAAGASRSVRVR